ncbi:MAG: amidohydrolase [Candidatus Latescibacterota bacterium]|nr:MAG: amidohydrolase [Candidatus Latescibacterota bacterium]
MSDILFKNGMFYGPQGEFWRGCLRVEGNRIVSVEAVDHPGSESRDSIEVVDVDGGFVIPGFVDAHVHLSSLALKRLRCDLSPARSAKDVRDRLAEWAADNDSPFVIGVDFDESRWEHQKLPTRHMLDGVDDRRPVFARRICGHIGVVNSMMLERIKSRPDLVDRDTGVVTEHAVWEAGRMCEPESEAVIAGTADAIKDLFAVGITTVHDIVEEKKFDQYLTAISKAQTPLRIDALINTNPRFLHRFVSQSEATSAGNLRVVGAKCFLDGSIGGRTAALNADYADHPGWGTLLMQRPVLQTIAGECFDSRYLLAIHAIGDRAVDLATGVVTEFPAGTESFRIEHCEVTAPPQIERLKHAPAFLCLQPNFVRNWGGPGGLNETRLGRERNRWCNAHRSLYETGRPCIFGSDGMPPGPLYGIKGSIEHPVADERMTPQEALACYTATAHTVGAHKREAGVLEPGNFADLVVLTDDPLSADPDTIQVKMTVVDGEVVHRSSGAITP